MLTVNSQCELLTVGSCCATCRDLGFANNNEMRSIAAAIGYVFFLGNERNNEFARQGRDASAR
jgi:hypothetical protein